MDTILMLSVVVILSILTAVILLGFRRIEANPPHKGQATKWGKKIPGKSYDEGWGWYPLYPLWYGIIPIPVKRISFEIVSEKTRTPDRAESRVPTLITIRPLSNRLIEYIDSGQEEGVKTQLTGKVLERIREWAMGPEEGPATWIELNQSHLEAVSVLVRKIANNSLTQIPTYAQHVPTWIWLRYYAQPQPTAFFTNEDTWAHNNWERVHQVLTVIESDLGLEAVENLKTAVATRRREIEALRTGTGNIILEDLGVVLERLNIGEIQVLGGVAEQAEGEAREEQERQEEARELEFVRQRIAELMLPPFNFTNSQALDIVQTERGKVVRTIDDKKLSVDATTAQVVASALRRMT